jgi:hypothetical protein
MSRLLARLFSRSAEDKSHNCNSAEGAAIMTDALITDAREPSRLSPSGIMRATRTVIVTSCLALLLAANAWAEDARAVLERAIQAHGGEDRIARTKTGRLKATVEGKFRGDGVFKATWEETFDLPGRYRRVIEGSENGRTFHREFIVNGAEGWIRLQEAVQAFPVREPLPLEQHWHAVLLQLVLLKNKDTRLTLLGEEQREGRAQVGIRAVSPRGEGHLFFDQATWLLARARRPMPNPLTGLEMFGETIYDDYRTIDGVHYPMHLKAANGDTYSLNTTLTSLEFLDRLDPRIFAKPETAAPHEANPPTDKRAEKDTEASAAPAAPAAETPRRWDTRLIVATLAVGVFVGVVWWIVHRSRGRSQQSSPP